MKPLLQRYYKGNKIPHGVYMVYYTPIEQFKIVNGKPKWVLTHYAFYIIFNKKPIRIKESDVIPIPKHVIWTLNT